MILWYVLLIGSAAAIKIDLREVCRSSSVRCSISNCNDETLVIDSSETSFPFREVAFRSCYLPTIPSAVFSTTPKLERLLMYKCSIKNLQQMNFDAAGNLRFLYLPSNRITELPENVFANLSSVEEIRLTNNYISHMHSKAFSRLSQLRALEMNYNKIHELSPGLFAKLTNLEYIDLSFNDIESMDSLVFASNLRLKTILLSNNNFAVFESNTLSLLPHLNVLDISFNKVTAISLQSVNTLRAQSAQLRSCVINGTVIRIRASNNQLENIEITDKSSVTEIDVHSNKFDSLANFHGMVSLQKLDVSKNAIRTLTNTSESVLLSLPSLQYFNVANAQLQALTAENLVLLAKLTHIDLASNNLKSLDAAIFEPLTNLEKFYIEGNYLQSFDYETFMRNHANLKEMGILGNNWPQSFLKKMSDVLSSNDVKLIVRLHPSEAAEEMLSMQTTSHPHHTVHAKTLDRSGLAVSSNPSNVDNRDILIIVTLCLVLLILVLQLIRFLKEENVFALFSQGIRRTIPPRRLDEEESEPL